MIAHPFNRAIDPVIESADHGGPGHDADIRHCLQPGDGFCRPGRTRHTADRVGLKVQASADQEILVTEDHPCAAFPGGQRGSKASRATADDQNVTMQEAFVVAIGIVLRAERPKASCAADDRLIDLFPERGGPHECLVIEPGGKEVGQKVVHLHRVKGQRRPTVLRIGPQPVIEFRRRRPRVGFLARAFAQFDNRVGFFRSGGHRATRAVVFERPSHQAHDIGQQGGGQRVALVTLVILAVETEGIGLGPVDQPAVQTVLLAHADRSSASATSRANSTDVISCVTVFRVTTSHDRSPCS